MNTDGPNRGEKRFEALRTCLNTPCKNLLRKILKLKFKRYENLKSKISWDKVSSASKLALEKLSEISQLKFTLLCEIFRSGVCDCYFGSPTIGWSSSEKIPERCTGIADDILRIWKIWEENIENNLDDTISDNDSNNALSILMDIANRMSIRPEFKDIGLEFQREISLAREGNFDGPRADAIQAGDGNTIEINCGSSFKGSVQVVQGGNNNKVILYHLVDDRNILEYTSSGYVKAVLHSDNPAFQDLADSACNLNIEEINELPALKSNDVSIKEIKRGSLVVMLSIKNTNTLEENIQWIFQCMFGRKEIAQILDRHDVDEVRVHGYIYNPHEYCLDFRRDDRVFHSEEEAFRATKFHFHSHLTWSFAECTCDIDVFLTDLFYNLTAYDFTTEVNDNIWMMTKGNIIHPKDITFSSLARMLTENVDEKIRNINFQLAKSGCFEIQSIKNAGSSIHLNLKTKACQKYTSLLAEDGVIFALMKRLLLFVDLISQVKLMRIGMVIDTKLMQNQHNQKDRPLVVEFCKESKITEAMDKGAFPQILTSVLSKCKNVDEEMSNRLKIKVEINSETRDGKIVVAIDIGTTYSGYAFAVCDELEKDPLKTHVPSWDYPNGEPVSAKIPSTILLDKDKNLIAFGIDAERKYTELLDKKQHLSFYYFHRFKMLFNKSAKEKQLTTNICIPDDTKKELPATLVFSHALSYLKDHFVKTLKKRGTFFKEDEISWILTIPVMWSDAEKLFMEAASEAGIPKHQLTTALEPQAAILWYKHFQKEQALSPRERGNYHAGCKYIVLDAGGTVNITLCQETGDGELAKVDRLSSLEFGGIGVDQAFEKVLTEIVGDSFFEQYKKKHPKDYAKIFRGFEVKKRSYNRECPPDQKITLKIPFSFAEECREKFDMDLNLLTSKTKYRYHIHWEREKLCIDLPTFSRLFESIGEEITRTMQELLQTIKVKEIGKILMVGGFSENFILQDAVKNAFPGLTVIVPKNAELAIMEGALHFCHNPLDSDRCFYKYEKTEDFHEKNSISICNFDSTDHKGRVVAAIEIGTTFSGYAFIFRHLQNDPQNVFIPNWLGPGCLISSKTPTTLLLNKDKKFVAFGFEAESRYSNLKCDEEHLDYYYFPRFMTMLHDTDKKNVITDIMDKKMPVVDLLSMAISYLYNHCVQTVIQRRYVWSSDEIDWVLTVPSHWNNSERQLMWTAALNAGICPNKTMLALEPDAASIYYSILPNYKLQGGEVKGSLFSSGSKYLLLDAGGARLDMTVYEVLRNGNLMELGMNSVSNLGGMSVNQAFDAFLIELIGDTVFSEYCTKYFEDYKEFLYEFEVKKRSFGSGLHNNPNQKICLRFPTSMLKECKEKLGEDFKTLINKTKYRDHIKLSDKLIIDFATFNSFFKPACNEIIQHVQTLLTSPRLKETDKIFMVGGFSESTILQIALKDAFPQCRIFATVDAGIAVLKGAVLMGRGTGSKSPTRISKYNFGVDTF